MTPGLHRQTTDGTCFTAEMIEACTRLDHKSGAAPGKNPNPQGPVADPSPRARAGTQYTYAAQLNKLSSCLVFKEQ